MGIAIVDNVVLSVPGGGGPLTPIGPPPMGGPYPLANTRIGYDNRLVSSSVSPSGASVTLIPNTYERYGSNTDQVIEYTCTSNFDLDYVAIGAHNLGSVGARVIVEYSPTISDPYVEVYDEIQSSDLALMVMLTTPISARRVRITIEDPSGDWEIGVVYAGQMLQFERPLYGGHEPITLSPQVTYQNNVSDAGNWLSRSVIRIGLQSSYSWKYVSAEWVRLYLKSFISSAITTPFFIAWRPEEYPDEVALAWTTSRITVSNMGTRDLMTISMNVEAYGGIQ